MAIKIPYMQLESDPAAFSRFQREAEIGELLNHPNILKFIKVPNKSRQYIVTEYLEGKPLSTVLNEMRPLPIPDAVQIASYVCGALAHMHEHKVVHRDLKPQNIMICDDGSLRIIDFGIAKSTEMRRLTFAGFTPAMGTPDYMAPEQVKGKRGDERTDIYSLGAVLYEMTTGSVPFEGPNPFIVMNSRITGDPVAPRKVNPEISEPLEEIILHAMEREPQHRYQSAARHEKGVGRSGIGQDNRAPSSSEVAEGLEDPVAGVTTDCSVRGRPDHGFRGRIFVHAVPRNWSLAFHAEGTSFRTAVGHQAATKGGTTSRRQLLWGRSNLGARDDCPGLGNADPSGRSSRDRGQQPKAGGLSL